ncbi:hypothetical protein [Erythrobacter aureus]|uniref:hypothetical protein n=1 Tax=Erythrobacter aureus TaxID=2182384 RepID=UPI0013B3DCB8|nr:hypothetical protein [Erythrobacter aureus]
MMDLTGNGPPTASERLRQSLRLAAPHPRYTAIGSIFVSTCANGDALSAIVVRTADAKGSPREVVRLVTASGCETLDDGTDGDLQVELEASLFQLEPGQGWHGHSADDIAQKIARIGRHLHFHDATDPCPGITEDEAIILSDDGGRTENALSLMQGLLAYNGICGEDQEMHFFAATPLQAPEFRLVNINGHLSKHLEIAFKLYDQPQLKVRVDGERLYVAANGYAVNIASATASEQAEFTARIMQAFNKHGISTSYLHISSAQQGAA